VSSIIPHITSIQTVGNKHFHDIVSTAIPGPGYSSYDKPRLENAIIAKISGAGGRFLKKDPVTGNWYALGNSQAREKVHYALRDRYNKLKRKQTASESGTPLAKLQYKPSAQLPASHQDSASASNGMENEPYELSITAPTRSTHWALTPASEPTTCFVAQSTGETETLSKRPMGRTTSSHPGDVERRGKPHGVVLRQSNDFTVLPADVLCGKEKACINHGKV